MKRVINVCPPLEPSDTVLTPPSLVPLPAATNAFVARLLQHAERQRQAPLDGRRRDTAAAAADDAAYTPMTAEAWRADGLGARLQHMRDSMPLARADVAVWFTANTAGSHLMISSDAIPAISLGNSPLLTVIGASDAAARMMANDDAWVALAGAVVRDLWLDSFTTYTPPLFVLLNSAMPGIRRPVPATINTVQLAMYYLAYIKLAADIGYRAPAPKDGGGGSKDGGGGGKDGADRLAPVRRALEGGRRLRAEKLQRFGENLLHLRLGQARRLHRSHTFVMLRIIETELIGLVRLPGHAVSLLTSAMMHTPVPELTDEEREWDKTGRHTVLALMPGVWKRSLELLECTDVFRELYKQMDAECAVTRAYMAFVHADRAKSGAAAAAVAVLAAEPTPEDESEPLPEETGTAPTIDGDAELDGLVSGIAGVECNVKGDARDEEDVCDAPTTEAELERVMQERRDILARRDDAAARADDLRAAWLAEPCSAASDDAGRLERDIERVLRSETPPNDEALRALKGRLALLGDAADGRLRAGMLCVEALRLAKSERHRPGIRLEERRVGPSRHNMPRVAKK